MLSFNLWAADDHATISLSRWQNKIVVTVNHDEGWHTYWKNPGDAGIASSFKFFRNKKMLSPKAYEWPAPKRNIEAGNILTIGYEKTQHFFFDEIKDTFNAEIGVLICKDICIPGEAKLSLAKDQVFSANRDRLAYSDSELKTAFDHLPDVAPLPTGFEFYLTRKKGQPNLTLHYSLKGLSSDKLPHELHFLTSFPTPPFGFKREELYFKDQTLYGKTEIEWDGEYQEPIVSLPENGHFPKAYKIPFLFNSPLSGKVEVITLEIKDFSIATAALDDFYHDLNSNKKDNSNLAKTDSNSEKSLLHYLFFAFLGGLILNLMPCVLPVISLKLFGLIKHKNYPRERLLKHNLSYTAGILFTLMVLASVISALKLAGEKVGWGFQLQSPSFILVMMIILFILSLNLFGLFEFITPGGSKLGSAKVEESFIGDFFSGVLTTILSTPCSAPFLGTALTFAFTTHYSTIFIMFSFIGLGLAFPFLLTALFPQSLALFPRPGAWMEKLKYFLGLSLVLTIIWLYDVFISLVNFDALNWRLNLLFVLWFFAFFFAQKISKQRVLQLLIFALPISLSALAIQNLELRDVTHKIQMEKSSMWTPWSMEKLSAEKGKLIFMDFTAEWCLTCKVNKKLVLETNSFTELAKKHDLTLMRADWTKRDDYITDFLYAHKAAGVPAYFIQKKNGEIISLGETISISKLEENLR